MPRHPGPRDPLRLVTLALAMITLLADQVVHPVNAYAAGAFYQPATFAAANYGASPLAYAAAPAAREGILTRVQLNPGHALSYRVD